MFWKSRGEHVLRRRRRSAVEEAINESRALKSKKGPLDLAAGQVLGTFLTAMSVEWLG